MGQTIPPASQNVGFLSISCILEPFLLHSEGFEIQLQLQTPKCQHLVLSRSAGQALQGTSASGSTSSGSTSCYSLQPLDLDFPKCPPIPPNCAVSKTLSSPDSEILLAGQLKRSELCSESIIPTGGQGGQTTQVVFTDCEALMTDASTKAQYFSNCCLAALRRI